MTGRVLALQIISHVDTLHLSLDLAVSVAVEAELIVHGLLALSADSPRHLDTALLSFNPPLFQRHWSTVLHYGGQTDLCKQLDLLDPALSVGVDRLGSWRWGWRWYRVHDRRVMEYRRGGRWGGTSSKGRGWGTGSKRDWMNQRRVTEDGTGHRRWVG